MSSAIDQSAHFADFLETIDRRWRDKVSLCRFTTRRDADPANSDITLGSIEDPSRVLDIVIQGNLNNFCQLEGSHLESELNTSAKMIVEPESFVNHPLSSILTPKAAGAKTEKHLEGYLKHFSKASEKGDSLDGLEEFLKTLTKSSSLITQLVGAADELFTNAVFNAPFVDVKSKTRPQVDRKNSSIQMNQDKHASLFAGFKDGRVVVGCKDPFGTLDLSDLLNRIRGCYTNGVGPSINLGPGGAGIGSYLVFNTGTSYYVGIIRGEATVVCLSVPVNISSKKRELLPKNLHFFEIIREGS